MNAITSIRRGSVLWGALAALAATVSLGAEAQPVLQYDETAEVVRVMWQGQTVTHQYDEARSGFVNGEGDWVAWDDQAGNWLYIARRGNQARFDAAGAFLGVAAAPEGNQGDVADPGPEPGPVEVPAFDPRKDVGDSRAKKNPGVDSQALALQYLQQADLGNAQAPKKVSGEDFGLPLQNQSIGPDVAAREKQRRDEWKQRQGAHQSDPNAAMETGAVENPIDRLVSTIGNIQSTLSGVTGTIRGVEDLKDMFDGGNILDGGKSNPVGGVAAGSTLAGAVRDAQGTPEGIQGQSGSLNDRSTIVAGNPASGNSGGNVLHGGQIPYTQPPPQASGGPSNTKLAESSMRTVEVDSAGNKPLVKPDRYVTHTSVTAGNKPLVKPQQASVHSSLPQGGNKPLVNPDAYTSFGKPPAAVRETYQALPAPPRRVHRPGIPSPASPPKDVFRDPGLRALPPPEKKDVVQDPGLRALPAPGPK